MSTCHKETPVGIIQRLARRLDGHLIEPRSKPIDDTVQQDIPVYTHTHTHTHTHTTHMYTGGGKLWSEVRGS